MLPHSDLKNYSCTSLLAQQVKDLTLSVRWLGLLLWHGFDPCPGTSTCCECGQKKRRKIFLFRLNYIPSVKSPSQVRRCRLVGWKVPFVSNVFGNYLQFRFVGSLWRSWIACLTYSAFCEIEYWLLEVKDLDSFSGWATRHVTLGKSLSLGLSFLWLTTKIPSLKCSKMLGRFHSQWRRSSSASQSINLPYLALLKTGVRKVRNPS